MCLPIGHSDQSFVCTFWYAFHCWVDHLKMKQSNWSGQIDSHDLIWFMSMPVISSLKFDSCAGTSTHVCNVHLSEYDIAHKLVLHSDKLLACRYQTNKNNNIALMRASKLHFKNNYWNLNNHAFQLFHFTAWMFGTEKNSQKKSEVNVCLKFFIGNTLQLWYLKFNHQIIMFNHSHTDEHRHIPPHAFTQVSLHVFIDRLK